MISAYGSKWSLDIYNYCMNIERKVTVWERNSGEATATDGREQRFSIRLAEPHIGRVTSGIVCETNGQEKESQPQPRRMGRKKKLTLSTADGGRWMAMRREKKMYSTTTTNSHTTANIRCCCSAVQMMNKKKTQKNHATEKQLLSQRKQPHCHTTLSLCSSKRSQRNVAKCTCIHILSVYSNWWRQSSFERWSSIRFAWRSLDMKGPPVVVLSPGQHNHGVAHSHLLPA